MLFCTIRSPVANKRHKKLRRSSIDDEFMEETVADVVEMTDLPSAVVEVIDILQEVIEKSNIPPVIVQMEDESLVVAENRKGNY